MGYNVAVLNRKAAPRERRPRYEPMPRYEQIPWYEPIPWYALVAPFLPLMVFGLMNAQATTPRYRGSHVTAPLLHVIQKILYIPR